MNKEIKAVVTDPDGYKVGTGLVCAIYPTLPTYLPYPTYLLTHT